MLSSRSRVLVGGASALAISLLGVLPAAMPAAAGTGVPHIRLGHVMYDVGVHSNVTRAQATNAAAATSTFTQFKATVKVGTKSFTYVMAGKNPAVKVTNASSTIKVELVPLIIKFSNGDSWNPTAINNCDSASTMTRVQQSPIFNSRGWTWGGTSIGTSQVTDAFQRAEFWKYAKPGGINPSYHVVLSKTTLPAVTLNVPNADAATAPAGCGNNLLGAVNINWLDPQLQSNVIPKLTGVSPATLPIFILHNVVEYVGTTTQCCVLGYHNAFNRTTGVQTYGLAMYDNSGDFSGSHDISALSHEVAEWQDDPYTNNPTPAWGHIGQVSGCQSNLEVGDPLSGTTFSASLNGFTYHPQELAFFSWFYHQSPSLGVNGWYSDQGKFKTFAANCT
jgi:hypothetical protein